MNDQTLIDAVLDDENATPTELDLAERLGAALAELARMTSTQEKPSGSNA